MTPHETAVKIAEACMDAIEKRRGIIKDDLIEAARGVIAGNLSGPASGYPTTHYVTPLAWNAELAALIKAREEVAKAMDSRMVLMSPRYGSRKNETLKAKPQGQEKGEAQVARERRHEEDQGRDR